ncbi:MAG: toll/interleukin-1 receptor domain-containing protein [Bacteroidota bacterium]
MLTKTSTLSVFIAYAEADVAKYKEISHQLDGMKRSHKIHISDMHATTSEEGRGVRLENADVILALVTPNYINSKECRDVEAVAMHRHVTQSAIVLPILMEPADLAHTHFRDVDKLPTNGQSVSQWSDHQSALDDIHKGIRHAISAL